MRRSRRWSPARRAPRSTSTIAATSTPASSTVNAVGRLPRTAPQGTVFAKGQFNYNDTWRWGFDLNRASSVNYITDFNLGSIYGGIPTVLTSQVYAEGFGEGAYARADVRFYQGVSSTIVDSKLPVVLPRYEYSYFGKTDALGGRLSLDTGAFNVMRTDGTNTRRADLVMNWDRPGRRRARRSVEVHAAQHGRRLRRDGLQRAAELRHRERHQRRARPAAGGAAGELAVHARFGRLGHPGDRADPAGRRSAGGRQQPVQQIPERGQPGPRVHRRQPVQPQPLPGIDRLEGGHARRGRRCTAPGICGGTAFDALVGQSYQPTKDNNFTEGVRPARQVSDIVARASFTPTPWLDLTYRTRLDTDHAGDAFRRRDGSGRQPAVSPDGRLHLHDDQSRTPITTSRRRRRPATPSTSRATRSRSTAESRFGGYHLESDVRRDLARQPDGADRVLSLLRGRMLRSSTPELHPRYTLGRRRSWRHHDAVPDHVQDGRQFGFHAL